MIVHLFQFRFGDTQPYKLRPPPLMINFDGINPFSDSFLHLFFVTDPSVPEVEVRDIYKLEYDLFQSWGWVWYYMLSVLVFATHFWLGWEKVVPASQLGIPKALQFYVTCMGWAICVFVALCYLCFPIFAYFSGHDFSGPSIGVNGSY
jgi:hypothetical protein